MSADAPLLQVQNLVVRFTNQLSILKNISFTVFPGEIVVLIGPSGAGKSTLLRCCNRLVTPSAGAIFFHGADITSISGSALRHIRRKIGMVFQDYPVVKMLSVRTNVMMGRLGYLPVFPACAYWFPRREVEKAEQLLREVGLEEKRNERAGRLSGGQMQRVGIARALMQEPELLLADEPVSNLDLMSAQRIIELFQRIYESRGITILISLHDVALARSFGKKIVAIRKGEIVWTGAPGDLSDSLIREIYR